MKREAEDKRGREKGTDLARLCFGFVDVSLDPADLFGHRDLLRTDLRALPKGLAAPSPILVVKQSDPLL